jgi:transposase
MPLTREEITALYSNGVAAVIGVIEQLVASNATLHEQLQVQAAQIAAQEQVIATLSARVKELDDQRTTNSRNSSKPPSSDGYARPPRSLRQASGKKPGGQPGHVGSALHMVDQPDQVVVHSPTVCGQCQHSLADMPARRYERRQVFELPPLRLEVWEHRAEEKHCPVCAHSTRGVFPADVTTEVQYGVQIKALAVYLVEGHLLPYDRTRELLVDLFGQGLTEGAVWAAVQACAAGLAGVEEQSKDALCAADVLHNDETGVRVAGKLYWLHVASTAQVTHYAVHPKRGSAATAAIGILPRFGGTSVHDGLEAYRQYGCAHALCNAHHLRELTAVEEHDQQPWATQMKELLLAIKAHIAEQQACGEERITAAAREDFVQRYQDILAAGSAANPPAALSDDVPKKRGRPKQSKAKNLVDRLSQHQQEVLAFMDDWRVPFDNNLAERDLRMVKVQQKVSGCFRTPEGAAAFCRIRGYISTLKKQGLQVLPALRRVLLGDPLLPDFAAE